MQYYTEEELLEAVDILMEDYNLSEEEAIDIIMEETDAEKKARRKENLKRLGHKAGQQVYRRAATSAVIGGLAHAAMPVAYKKAGYEVPKEIKRNAIIGGAAAATGTAILAHRAYKKHQAKKQAKAELKENSILMRESAKGAVAGAALAAGAAGAYAAYRGSKAPVKLAELRAKNAKKDANIRKRVVDGMRVDAASMSPTDYQNALFQYRYADDQAERANKRVEKAEKNLDKKQKRYNDIKYKRAVRKEKIKDAIERRRK